ARQRPLRSRRPPYRRPDAGPNRGADSIPIREKRPRTAHAATRQVTSSASEDGSGIGGETMTKVLLAVRNCSDSPLTSTSGGPSESKDVRSSVIAKISGGWTGGR